MSISYTADQLQKKFQGAPGASGFARIAETLREEGRHEEAVALCQEGLRQRPLDLTGRLVLGKCLIDMDRLDEAREQLEGVLRQDPRCLSAMHLLARIMTSLQWGEAAAAYYRSILELEPWDAETLARFREVSPSGAAGFAPAASGTGLPGGPAPEAPPVPTLESLEAAAPAGPDVEEFDLNKVTEFPSEESSPGDLAGALEEVSLEDALGGSPEEPRAYAPAPPQPVLEEPKPLDILLDAPPAIDPGSAVPGADEPAPISGDDVGDRLDSLFGAEDDGPLVTPPAPSAGSVDPEIAEATLQIKALRDQEGPQASGAGDATPFSAPMGDLAAATSVDFAPAPMEAAAHPDGPGEAPAAPLETPVFAGRDALPPEERVSGEDIEARLDDLFSLHDTAAKPVMKAIPDETGSPDADYPAFTTPETASPVAAEPADPSAASAPEAVETWSGAARTEGIAEGEEAGAGIAGDLVQEAPASSGEDVFLSAGPANSPEVPTGAEVVTGQDVADKLDALFGGESPRPAERPEAAASSGFIASGTASWAAARPAADETGDAGTEGAAPALAGGAAPAWDEGPEAARPPSRDFMTTESMLPRGPEPEAGPPITGEDIEARLDSLFDLADEGSRSGGMVRGGTPVEEGRDAFSPPTPEEVTSEVPQAPVSAGPLPAEDADDGAPAKPAAEAEASDWLARVTVPPRAGEGPAAPLLEPKADLPGAGDTLFLRNEDVFAEEPAAPPVPGVGDTVGLEMVDGEDIAGRLDRIFAAESPDAGGPDSPAAVDAAIARGEVAADMAASLPEPELPPPIGEIRLPATGPAGPQLELEPELEAAAPLDEVALFAEDPAAALGLSDVDPAEPPRAGDVPAETVISGDDIKARLSEIFESPAGQAVRPMEDEDPETPVFLANPEIASAAADAVEAAGEDPGSPPSPQAAGTPAMDAGTRVPETGKADLPSLAPLQDEEEGGPEEEEYAPQSAAGANVATVTLAEIYFQQGLREQALQIYRQLLEREPGNDSVRKRIQEIEASKPEPGAGPGSDPRRPRPGLKVPKRKK